MIIIIILMIIKDQKKEKPIKDFILDKIIKAYIDNIDYNNNKVSSEINKYNVLNYRMLASILNRFRKK